MRILAVANQKGGCGKTTVAVNLASALADRGRRVLLVDLDPQAHATAALGVDPAEVHQNLYDVLTASEDRQVTLDRILIERGENLFLAPSAVFLSAVEQELSGVPGREERLLKAIRGLDQFFRYIILDCPPSLGLLTFNALRAAGEVLVPVEPSSFSLRGIQLLQDSVEILENASGHDLRVYPIANNINLRTRFGRAVLEEIRQRFGERAMKTIIPPSTRVKEAAALGKPLTWFDPSNSATRAFKNLAWEILAQEEEPEIKALEERLESQASPHLVEEGKVLFRFRDPQASTVYVVGEFNNWTPNQEARMEPKGQGLFETRIDLEPGIYQYRFIVDGRWVEDPENPRTAPAPFGGVNSVLEVRGEKEKAQEEAETAS